MSIAGSNPLAHFAKAQYPVNLRITIPFYPLFLFITLIMGTEKRGRGRQRLERGQNPVGTWGNVLTVTMALGIAAVAALFATLVAAAL